MNEQNMSQEQKPANIWKILASVLITAVVVGVVVYALQSSSLPSTEQSLEQQITQLQNEQIQQNQNQQATQPQEIIYSNSQYGFSLKLPTDWRVVDIQDGGAMFGPKSIAEDTLFGVIIVPNIPILGTKGGNFEITKVEKSMFNGFSATKVYTKNLSVNKESVNLYIEKDRNIFSIGQPTLDDSDFPFENKYNETISQILSTFKFTK